MHEISAKQFCPITLAMNVKRLIFE